MREGCHTMCLCEGGSRWARVALLRVRGSGVEGESPIVCGGRGGVRRGYPYCVFGCLGVGRGSPNMCRGSWVGGVALLNVGGAKLDGVALLCVCMGWGGGWANVAILCMWGGRLALLCAGVVGQG